MQAAYFLNSDVHVGQLPDPTPAKGQVLVRTHRCGLCASESHFLESGQEVVNLCKKHGGPYAGLDLNQPFVPGHEYVGEILDYGPGSAKPIAVGRKVTSIPIMRQGGAHSVIGFNNQCPGGYGEYLLLDENFLIEVPNDLDDDLAALTEPLAVGLEHARRGQPSKDDVPLVVGCGAIGLGVIVGLKLMNIGPIIAADYHPSRRQLALAMGADVVIDPRELSPFGTLPEIGARQANLVYECAGVPGLLQMIIQSITFDGRIVMGGYCMAPDQIYTFSAQNKRLTVYFAGGEEPQDMALALKTIASGQFNMGAWLGPGIGLGGVKSALATMSGPKAPVRTLIDPRRP